MKSDNITDLDFALDIDFGKILTNPILDIAARFWEPERYEAFRTCYRSMRIIDDLVDNRKIGTSSISAHERAGLGDMINDWVESLRKGLPTDLFQEQLLQTMRRFCIPLWPWERLAKAMIYDVSHSGFASFRVFLRYCEGAAIAPASVFMHLCAIGIEGEHIVLPPFNIRRVARPLALFSYLVHIMRDFQKDQLNRLNYFADNILAESKLSQLDLLEAVENAEAAEGLRYLMSRYRSFADYYRRRARSTLDEHLPLLGDRYQLSLEVIYRLYVQIFERIRPQSGSFTTTELNPSPDEVHVRLKQVVADFRPV